MLPPAFVLFLAVFTPPLLFPEGLRHALLCIWAKGNPKSRVPALVLLHKPFLISLRAQHQPLQRNRKAQRGEVTCPTSHSHQAIEPDSNKIQHM